MEIVDKIKKIKEHRRSPFQIILEEVITERMESAIKKHKLEQETIEKMIDEKFNSKG